MNKRPLFAGILVFVVIMLLTQGLAFQRYVIMKSAEERELDSHANWTKERLQSVFSYSFSTTRSLAFIIDQYGVPQDFDKVAGELLRSNPYIDAVELVEGGVITHIYPLPGNEKALGVDILKDTARRSGALTAIKTRDFFVAGPIHFLQGGEGFIARLPIFKQDTFWGFSAVIIRLPTLLKAAQIDTSSRRQYSYQLAKVNPENGHEEFFLQQGQPYNKGNYVPVELSSGEWRLYIMPEKSTTIFSVAIFSVLGLLLSVTGGVFAWFIVAQPIRLKKQVAEKVQQVQSGENIFRTTLERISVGFASFDKDFRFLYANKKMGELMNRDPGTLTGKVVWEEFPEIVGTPTQKIFKQAIETQKNTTYIDNYEPLDMWQENDVYPAPDGLTVFVKDITEAVRAKNQVALEKNLSESIINSLPGVFYLFDENGENLRWNKNLEEVGGYNAEEVSKMHPLDFFDGDDKERIHETIKEVFAKGRAEVEAVLVDKHGKKTPYYFNGWAITYEGKPCIIGLGLDITEKKKAENALKGSEEKYRYLFDNNPATVIIWDMVNLRLLEVNKLALQQYGYTREEFLSMTVLDYRPEEDREEVKKLARTMLKGEKYTQRKTWRHLKKNGEMMYMDIESHRIDYGGRIAVLSLAKDITEQVLAENKLKETYEDIRRLNTHLQTIREDERSTIAREIHDELGQQLTGIKMDISWLAKKTNNNDDVFSKKITDVLALIDETVRTVRRIASDLRPGVLDDLGLVAALEWQSGEFEKRTGIPCIFHTSLTELNISKDMATGFFRLYQESLTNIMRHAKATEVKARLEQENGFLILTITDNGQGFDMQQVQHKRTLGLIGMKERALMMGGELDINSQPGAGTTVTLKVVMPSE